MGTGTVQGSTASRWESEDTGKHHTSCGGKMDSWEVQWPVSDQYEVVLWHVLGVEEETLGGKWASEDKSSQSNN